MLRIEGAGIDNLVVDLPQHVGILQRPKAAPRVFVADIALRRHGDDFVNLAVRVFVLHIFRFEQARRNFRSRPDVAQLQPVVDRRIDLFGGIGRQHAFVDPGVGIIPAGPEAVDGIVNHRLDAGLIQRRNHADMERGFRRKHHAGRFDAERGTDDAAMPFDLLDDVAGRGQRHQRMEEAEGREIHAGMTERGLFLSDGAQFVVPAAEAPAAQALGGAAVQLFDQRTAPTGGQPGVRQTAADVLAHGVRNEMGVGPPRAPKICPFRHPSTAGRWRCSRAGACACGCRNTA
jgi:hypothetical protein